MMLYGCCDASQVFHKTFSTWLMEYGFEALDADRTLFKLKTDDGTVMILALYVDDGLVSHNNDKAYAIFIKALSTRFELSAESTEVSWYLGVSIQRDWVKGTIKLSQEQYVKDLLNRFEMSDCNPVVTPLEVGQRLTSEDCPEVPDKKTVKHYQQLVGSLNYLVAWCYPELAFPVSQCARFMSNPGPSHVAAAKRVLRYCKDRMHGGITYTKNSSMPNQLYTYADADHAGDPEGRRSVTGYVVMLNGRAVSWQSERQAVTALSSAESEYYAASALGCEIVALRRIMNSMGYEQLGPTPCAEDNVACIYMSRSSAMYNKGKDIDVRVYKLREFVEDGVMELYHVPTDVQVADCMTKALPAEVLRRHRSIMSGCGD
eukprot:903967-Rhodomonas_salina.2